MVYNDQDCLPLEGIDLTNKVLVLSLNALKTEYHEGKYQLWKATGGFGCKPGAVGSAVYSVSLVDGENARWERYQFIGILKEEKLNEINVSC